MISKIQCQLIALNLKYWKMRLQVIHSPENSILEDTTTLGSGSSKNLLNGSSSQNSPINVLLNIATATTAARNLNLVLNYDALIEIDPTSMVSARV